VIKSIPGWLNFILLFWAYFAIGEFLRWITKSSAEHWFIALFCAFFCGAYLAKWRFYDGQGWRFW